METIKIPFTGINRSIDEGISTDGQCMELINARIKNGSIEPIGQPVFLANFEIQVDRLFYHSIVHKYIALTASGDVYSLNEDYSISEKLSTDLNNTKKVEFLGNIACFFTEEAILYAIYSKSAYIYLGKAPDLPEIQINKEIKIKEETPDRSFDGSFVESRPENYVLICATGYYDKLMSSLNKESFYPGHSVLIRYAFRLSNGEYIKHSEVILVEHPTRVNQDWGANFYFNGPPFNVRISDSCTFYAFGMKLTYKIPSLDLNLWEDIIVGIDVFASSVKTYKSDAFKHNGTPYSEYPVYNPLDPDEWENLIPSIHQFYKVAEFNLQGEQTFYLDDISKDNLAIQQEISDDQYTNNTYSSQVSYIYNSRLHIANIIESFFKGYNTGFKMFGDYGNKVTATIYTYINTINGETVVKNMTQINYPYINPYLTYPDYRAKKMIFIVQVDGKTLRKDFHLKKHQYLNLAYYQTPRTDSSAEGETFYKATYISVKDFPEGVDDILVEREPYIERPNVLKVSSLNNPLYFPADQTYQPSNGEIVGLCANTTALSQGQFGQYPLYVFSKDGIFAMSVGTNSVAYAAQTPVTRDTCINAKSVVGIDKAVLFASKRGLMMITENNSTQISQDLDGYLPSCITSSPIISKIAGIASMINSLSSVVFNEYLSEAELGYNYQANEVLVANKNYNYSYLYNLSSGTWSKLNEDIHSFVIKYPECYAIINNSLYDMQNDHRSITNILLLSRPIKMGSNSHKRIIQTALRGIVKRAMSDLYLRGEPVMFRGESLNIFSDIGLYILGSNDAEHFTLISGKESIVDIRDLVTKMNKSKAFKFFMIALAGGVRTDVSLNYMEFVASEAFENRLR
ncbi:MAG: hypothetical protein KHX11_20115 [Bacteroides cellulosilyticus]|uniref:hypothetical protein n=1 Tax=Bacteroides cellulosilyticus TaxID=246787 RepID=UPI0029557A5D|nr:hypothetical protein [Bacteroides cellulosilyticus]MBS5701332.1 hypothetical protein [Bacteroides cellulosilyticus]MDV7049980.1 hypothetical protein [Bacteroides cellulosilyticus]